jgi:hypothetical protein
MFGYFRDTRSSAMRWIDLRRLRRLTPCRFERRPALCLDLREPPLRTDDRTMTIPCFAL